ncbi:L-histidine N(alpha)-methyltransferase [Streptomyces sp. NPDC059009]|uniref:L-histidine N(alpha)-methyltransferase n=1 Tax=Streptomyces sp. NPDC059009 TaxID=3346694 RepID=UPI0036A98107
MSPFLLTRTLPEDATDADLRADVLHGLTRPRALDPARAGGTPSRALDPARAGGTPSRALDPARAGGTPFLKSLPPKWFYDARGSELFEEITELPEYYPTRAERAILHRRAARIAEVTEARTLVELGSGSSEKTRHLIAALPALHTYVPVDVSESALTGAGHALLAEHPSLNVHALLADFTRGLALPGTPGPRLVAFLGGTIGNLLPAERAMFLSSVRSLLEPGDALLLGTDLVKDEKTLVAAYDDAAGVTAAFNKNVLTVINRELGADFDPAAFDHVAVWDRTHEWIEMRLRARSPQTVKIPALDLAVDFEAEEELRTEISAKFREEGIRSELAAAGLRLTQWWTDEEDRFALSLSVAD